MPETFLVTGSSGYIGSHIAKYFSRAGQKVVGLDKDPTPVYIKKYLSAFHHGDISEGKEVTEFCKKHSVIGVVHCAALALVAESVEKPKLYRDFNVTRATKLADSVIKAGVQTFLFSSTAAVYGEPQHLPMREDHPKSPVNPYGETKLEFEGNLAERAEKGELRVGILRYFNAAGADHQGELGEVHDPETHLIPNAILAATGKKKEFDVFGDDYPTRDGTCERDFIHVWDLADAHLRLMERILKTGEGGTYNLGTGTGYTVKEVLDEIDRQWTQPLPRQMKPRRPGDPAILVADATRARNELGWNPTSSDLSSIVSTALAWHQR